MIINVSYDLHVDLKKKSSDVKMTLTRRQSVLFYNCKQQTTKERQMRVNWGQIIEAIEEARDEYNSLFQTHREACEFESLVLNGLEHHMFKGQFDELWAEIQDVISGENTQPSAEYWNFLIEQKQQLNDE